MKNQTIDLMNFGRALGREEMRKLMAGSDCAGGCGGGGGGCSTCRCSYRPWGSDDWCNVSLTQCTVGWTMITCDGAFSGAGQYGGTVCGGQCP